MCETLCTEKRRKGGGQKNNKIHLRSLGHRDDLKKKFKGEQLGKKKGTRLPRGAWEGRKSYPDSPIKWLMQDTHKTPKKKKKKKKKKKWP